MSEDWEFKVDPKTIKKDHSDQKAVPIEVTRRSKKLELDLERAVKSRSMRVHAGKSYEVIVATPQKRFSALMIDASVALAGGFFFKTWSSEYLSNLAGVEKLPTYFYFFLGFFSFYFFPLRFVGQSLGRKIFRIRLEDIDGGPLGINRLFAREFLLKPLCFVGLIPLLVYLFNKKHFALHDKLMKSTVVDESKKIGD